MQHNYLLSCCLTVAQYALVACNSMHVGYELHNINYITVKGMLCKSEGAQACIP